MKNFWTELPKPFTALAPLDGVTDFVFRQIIVKLGKPNVLFTEFTSCDGMQSKGRKKVESRLLFDKNEKPIVAQIWGANPKDFYETAKYIKTLDFTGIDINMGCPIADIIKGGACSGLLKNPKLAAEIIKATKEGADGLPVSVKTRIGFDSENIEQWIGFLLKQDLAALSVHLRTVDEMSKMPAHWELMPQIIKLRNKHAPKTIITGNGDIASLLEVEGKYKEYGCEGFMVGRGIFVNPWMFNKSRSIDDISVEERFETFLMHIKLYEKTWENSRNFANLKKFCKIYINNFTNAGENREKIMATKSLTGLKETVEELRKQLRD